MQLLERKVTLRVYGVRLKSLDYLKHLNLKHNAVR